jgi:hypothetical protein
MKEVWVEGRAFSAASVGTVGMSAECARKGRNRSGRYRSLIAKPR